MSLSYLGELTLRLAGGAMQIPEARRQLHADYLVSLQSDDGGFPGRHGQGDCYYTGFAVRTLTLLGMLDESMTRSVSGFLLRQLQDSEQMPSIDFLSLIFSDVILDLASQSGPIRSSGREPAEEVRRRVAPYSCDDGGYTKTKKTRFSSTYHTFLVSACKQLVGIEEDRRDDIVQLMVSRQCDDGGFVELSQLRQSGTNPTAAAVGMLRLLGAEDMSWRQPAIEFLLGMQTTEGGFRANTRIPIADLLSTFTALVALVDLGAIEGIDHASANRYVSSLECEGGGFRAGSWDDRPDAEYTFYGVGAMAILGMC